MKIKDIIHEAGFWTGVKKALTPKTMKLDPKSLNPEDVKKIAKELYGKDDNDWLTPDEIAARDKPPPEPSPIPLTHPDVSVISSYPLRMRYKNGDFVLNPTTNQWTTVSGKKVSPELASFLQFQANKL